mmetsp:Transcript_64555/g.203765  ORF Transcript_64555/g.203765 Transcript_64555/m.203765 type:complete len:85 (-) Transcript_64555:522-776(-)
MSSITGPPHLTSKSAARGEVQAAEVTWELKGGRSKRKLRLQLAPPLSLPSDSETGAMASMTTTSLRVPAGARAAAPARAAGEPP